MQLQEMLNYCRAMMNEESAITPNWTDAELVRLVNKRQMEACHYLRVTGYATATSTAGSENPGAFTGTTFSNLAATFLKITRVWYAGRGLKYITMRQLESRRPTGTVTTGLPREWTQLSGDATITLSPTPSTTGDVITAFSELRPIELTVANLPGSAFPNSVFINTEFHGAIVDGVLADMYSKDLNSGFYDRYQKLWLEYWVPLMKAFGMRHRRRNSPQTVVDSDSSLETEFGVI